MSMAGALLMLIAAGGTAPASNPPSAPVRNVQRVEASVTIIAAEVIDVRVQLQRGSAQATARQYRERDKVPLVEFF